MDFLIHSSHTAVSCKTKHTYVPENIFDMSKQQVAPFLPLIPARGHGGARVDPRREAGTHPVASLSKGSGQLGVESYIQ